MIDSSSQKITKTLERYRSIIQDFEQKFFEKTAKITHTDLDELHTIIKQANQELRSAVKPTASNIPSEKLASKTVQAIKEFRESLAQKKSIIEMAAQQILLPVVYELEVSEQLLEKESKKKYSTVSDVEEGGLKDPSR
ncbi:hypothetical protein PHSC3_002002 [Chlamydiales bacterium STE3]|nr:hypothetical protein PHSC3_002002 [Chlamydiales bacterium STE3]